MNNLGMPIIGLGPRSAEFDHLPLQWMPHIQVADVAASVKRALDLGGKELMHAKTTMGRASGRCCSIRMGRRSGSSQSFLTEAVPPMRTAMTRRVWVASPGST